MKPWKLVLGAGAACAACCAAPIVSGMAAMGIGSGLFAGGGALSAAMQSWWPLAGSVALAAAAGVVVWRRRRAMESTAQGCGCQQGPGAACRTTALR